MFDGPTDRVRRISRRGISGVARSRAALRGALLAIAALAAGCAMGAPPPRAPAYEAPATVSGSVIFAPPGTYPEVELEQLAHVSTTPARLRRAWLELQVRKPEAALDTAAEVLFGANRPSANEESFARYLRAEAFAQLGHPERGTYDLGRARELALDPELQRRVGPKLTAPPAAAPALARLAVKDRASWSPRAPNNRNLDPMQRPTRITIHHSAMYFRDTRPEACAAQIARIQREHMENRGYGDIGYHFLIDPSGRIWEGRELRWQGAHARGDNNIGNIGICLLGNFVRQRNGQGPTGEQVRAMEQLVVTLMRRYEVGGEALHCHSDFLATECPGPRMEPIVKELARQLQTRGAIVATARDEEE